MSTVEATLLAPVLTVVSPGRKGHSFIGYFIFSLFFFPLALLMAYLVGDRTQPAY